MKKLTIIILFSVLCSVIVYSQVNLNYGLIAYYPFNGNTNDESGYGNNGIPHNITMLPDRFGTPNSAASFNGTNSYIEILDNILLHFGTSDYSYSFWLKYPSQQGGTHDYSSVVNKCKADILPFEGYHFFVDFPNYGKVTARDISTMELYSNYHALNNNVWHHFVVVRGAGDLRSTLSLQIYMNGVLDVSLNENPVADVNTTTSLFLGANNLYPDHQNYEGIMDEVRFYNRALNINEIKALYKQTLNSVPEQINRNNTNLIYPNPAKDFISIKSTGKSTVYLYNLTGNLLRTSTIEGESDKIDLRQMPKGAYLLKIENANSVINSILIKE